MIDKKKARRIIAVLAEIAETERRLEDLKSERDTLDEALREDFIAEGVQNIKTDDGTLYLQRRVYAKKADEAIDKAAMLNALRKAKLTQMYDTTVVWPRLSSFFGELVGKASAERDDDESLLPKALRGVFKVHNEIHVRLRAS